MGPSTRYERSKSMEMDGRLSRVLWVKKKKRTVSERGGKHNQHEIMKGQRGEKCK